ncbi:MAG: DnaA regulatory inactivator Hda [Gammaproteobacteria bacterium]|nr:DnaA regulatory inactivator Hda [Gammaproteobacteria bacterium]
MKQNALGIGLRSHATFDNFYSGDNKQAVALLKALMQPQGEPFIYLWGTKESGKSHLLQACCHLAGGQNWRTLYLPMAQIIKLDPVLLQDLEQCQLVCVDDLAYIAGKPHWEQALFDLYNRLRAAGSRFVVSAEQAPTQITVQLADLRSRLSWGVTLQLQPLSESGRLAALTLHAQARGFDLPSKVGHFLLSHYDRSMGALMAALAQLDQASLQQKRKLTVPFVKQTLAI